ncbi:MAG TPA: hypothetical protein VMY06_14875 [Sedimentisphaerales bacterium]|nr:hypothetical protein [Sedimentisphaerales bacterium]HUU15576.1 hypothetical protein [Sedimentisphaerales bacterium]
MPAFTGILEPSIFVEDTLRCSATIIDNTVVSPVDVCMLESVIPLGSGAWHSYFPIEQIERSRTGTKVDTFLDDYYYRIHVMPSTLHFGAIVTLITDEIIVWNAYFLQKTCSDIVEVNGAEWDLTGLATPFNLAALEYTTFTIEVPFEGSPTFEGSITFEFTDANDCIVLLSGTRVILFPWRPQQPVKETLATLTDIIVGGDRSEQRISTRPVPRQGFKFSVMMDSEKQQARLDAMLFSWQKRSFGLPVWPELVAHAGAINATDMAITVDTTNADFRDESLAVIWQSEDSCETVQVDTVAAGSLTLANPVQNTFTGSKLIMPVRTTQIDASSKRKGHSTGLAVSDFSFAVKDNVLLTGFTPATTYKGLPVLTEATAINPTQSKSSDADASLQDYETGDFDFFSDSDFNINIQSHLFHKDTKADCWEFRKFIHSLLGQQGTFYIPTHKEDMVLSEGFGAADTSFNIENIGLADNMGVNDLRTDIAFIFPDGTQLYREVTGIVKSGVVEIISIDSDLDIAVEPGDCVISWLDKLRLAGDEIEFVWNGAHELVCDTQLQATKA